LTSSASLPSSSLLSLELTPSALSGMSVDPSHPMGDPSHPMGDPSHPMGSGKRRRRERFWDSCADAAGSGGIAIEGDEIDPNDRVEMRNVHSRVCDCASRSLSRLQRVNKPSFFFVCLPAHFRIAHLSI
jgi:hypothetical protein